MGFVIFLLLGFVLFGGYCWLRFGPKKCPGCGRSVFGYIGPHIGIRRLYFHCPKCGARFEGHKRLPM